MRIDYTKSPKLWTAVIRFFPLMRSYIISSLRTIDDAKQLMNTKLKLTVLVMRPSKTDYGYASVIA